MSSSEDPSSTSLVQPASIIRAPDWRVVYCNAIGLGWGDSEARLNIGFDQDLAKSGTSVREELLVVMPHRAAKILAHSLGAIISAYEAANGPIPIPGDKLQEIDKAIQAQASAGKPPAPSR